jgi:acyl carrier protein
MTPGKPVPSYGETEARIRRILATELSIAPELLAKDAPNMILVGRGVGLDSVEALGLATGIETEFGITITDSELTLELFASLASLTDFVYRRISVAGTTRAQAEDISE